MSKKIEDHINEHSEEIFELRKLMKDELPAEIYEDKVVLYKFLKARNFNLKKSETMLRNHLDFRKQIQIETLKSYKSPELLHTYVAESFLGFDKEGNPLRYIRMGHIDGIGLFQAANPYYVLKHVLSMMERDLDLAKQQSEKLGKIICQSVYIFDMDKFSLSQATHKASVITFMKGVVIFQDNYPEMLKRIYIINAARYFTIVWPLVKTFLAPALLEKIRIYGQNGWKDELLQNIDAKTLPAFLGGERTDPDGNPQCLTIIKQGGKVPEKLFLLKDIQKAALKPGMKRITLERREMKSIPIYVEKPLSFLNWEFETKSYDIGFALFFEGSNKETEEIMPVYRHETDPESIYGVHKCMQAGKYTIVFDNSYSWLHQKEICYRTWITDSE